MNELLDFIYNLVDESQIWPSTRGFIVLDPPSELTQKVLEDLIAGSPDLKGFKATVGHHDGAFMATVTKPTPKTRSDVETRVKSL